MMLKFTEIANDTPCRLIGTATLTYDQRQKTRCRIKLDDGTEVGLFLQRGKRLQDGDVIQSETGECIKIVAAIEAVSLVQCTDSLLLAKICYHLGNRHVPLQIDNGIIGYQVDHVLDEMVEHFGLHVSHEQAPFEPEQGAYHSHHSSHE